MRAPDGRTLIFLAASVLLAACGSAGLRAPPTGVQVTPKREVHATDDDRSHRDASIALYQAGQLLAAGDLAGALRQARKAAGLVPDSPDPLLLQGVVHERAGEVEAAGEAYRKALALAPTRADAINNYGAWLCGQGFAAEALVIFDRALEHGEGRWHPGLLANAGTCALRAGQVERADRDLRAALALDRGNAQALEQMAQLQLQRGELLSARGFYQRRLAAAQPSQSVLQIAVEVEQGLGDEQAAGQYRQLLQQTQ